MKKQVRSDDKRKSRGGRPAAKPAREARSARSTPAPARPAAPAQPPEKQPDEAAVRVREQLAALSAGHIPVLVVGGGAAGLAAAITAAGAGVRTVLLEKADRVGRKLAATGNGRCNLSHEPLSAANYASADPQLLAQYLACRGEGAAVWLQSLGLLCRSEEGRIYPWCGQAATVVELLRSAAVQAGVHILCGVQAAEILREEEGFRLVLQGPEGLALPGLRAQRVILAAGGAAAPKLGGGMDGYRLAASLGHSCTPLSPALTAIGCRIPAADGKTDVLPALKGVRAQAAVTLYDGGRAAASDTGEVQFNENSLSGIPLLQMSLRLPGCTQPSLTLDLLPELTAAQTAQLVEQRCAAGGTAGELLLGTVHKKLGHAVMKCAAPGPLSRPAQAIGPEQRQALAGALKSWPVTLTGAPGWDGAQVAAGGVPLSQTDPVTCASRLCPGLYLAGEVLDAAGECGGFNLDWAFTTGCRAGAAAARSV